MKEYDELKRDQYIKMSNLFKLSNRILTKEIFLKTLKNLKKRLYYAMEPLT